MDLIKLEIIINNIYLDNLLHLLEQSGINGYTAVEISMGKGAVGGENLREGLLPTTRNTLLFSIIPRQVANAAIHNIQEFLNERAGVIITSKIEYASGYKKNNTNEDDK